MKLAAVALLVSDYDEAIAFFTAIGWDLTADEDQGGKRWVTVRGGATDLVLAQAATLVQAAAVGDQFGGRVGFFAQTDDFERDAARIEAAGGAFEERPRIESYGKVAVWRDPWGNRWDLIEPI